MLYVTELTKPTSKPTLIFLVLKNERRTKATRSKTEARSAKAVGFLDPKRKLIIYPIGF
ncbi:hypothetical protein Hanom_Chr01g00020291 [Helianthus anomalus]